MSVSIELHFFYKIKIIDRYQLSFQNTEQEIKNDKIKIIIPDSIFKYGKDKAQMSIKLFKSKSNDKEDYYFNIYYGYNSAYIQLDELHSNSYEIIFMNLQNIQISQYGTEFTELDTNGNKDKKRLVLINYSPIYLNVNGIKLNLNKIIKDNYADFSSSSASPNTSTYQLSEIDFKENKYIVKPFTLIEESNLKKIMDNKEKYVKFYDELDTLHCLKGDPYRAKLNEICEKYSDLPTYDFIKFNKTNEYLTKFIEENKSFSLDVFFGYFLYLYFKGNLFDYINEKTLIHCNFIFQITQVFDEIKEKKGIPMNEKIIALNALFLTNGKLNSVTDISNLNFKCYFRSEIFENSILDKVYKFLDNYIDELNEKSIVYENLLFLDGGYGYYNKEKVYTYDLTNLATLKSHLKELIPKILIFCYMDNNEVAFTAPEFCGIVINEKFILQNYRDKIAVSTMNYNKPITIESKDRKNMYNDITMNIVLDLIHEMMGHKKNSLAEPGTQSPKKIIIKKKLIELKYYDEYNPNNINDNSEYILTSDNGKGDSGHFLELSYGKIDNDLIIKLLFDMKNKGKLINRHDLFIDDGNKLKKFVSLRSFIEKNNIIFDLKNDMPIENEIEMMDKVVNNFKSEKGKIKIESIEGKIKKIEEKKEEDNKYIAKKRNNKEDKEINYRDIEKNKKKKLLNSNSNLPPKKNIYSNEIFSLYERIKGKSKEEILKMSMKRVIEKFKFKKNEDLRSNMIEKLKELKPNDPYYYDLVFLIEDSRRIV